MFKKIDINTLNVDEVERVVGNASMAVESFRNWVEEVAADVEMEREMGIADADAIEKATVGEVMTIILELALEGYGDLIVKCNDRLLSLNKEKEGDDVGHECTGESGGSAQGLSSDGSEHSHVEGAEAVDAGGSSGDVGDGDEYAGGD